MLTCADQALLRWRHPTRGLLSPAEFIPFAETNGLIVEIGDWVCREAARQVQRWQKCIVPDFQVSVNKSPVQFRRDASLYQDWLDYLRALCLARQRRRRAGPVRSDGGAGPQAGPEGGAEGVETAAQRTLLSDAGCDCAQGFMFGHPMAARELEALARR